MKHLRFPVLKAGGLRLEFSLAVDHGLQQASVTFRCKNSSGGELREG
jgi:hypothetical protein